MSLVSVIIPTYNRNDLLFNRSLPSVLNQTHREIEVLIIADGMKGAQLHELEEGVRSEQFDTNFVIKLWNIKRPSYPEDQHERWGMQALAARNHGLDKARGDFIAMLDDDDEMRPGAIELLLANIEGVDFVYGMSATFKGGVFTGQMYGSWPPGDGALCHGAFVMRPNAFRYRETGRTKTGDADMWERMYAGGIRFRRIPDTVHNYHRQYP